MKKNGKNIYPEAKHIHKCQYVDANGKECTNDVIQKPGSSYVPKYCKSCLPTIKKENARKGRNKISKIKKETEESTLKEVVAPSGDIVHLQDEEEENFYNLRKAAYLNDYGMINAADTTLLSLLLTLEIESRRIEKELLNKNVDKWLQDSLLKVAEQIRRVQQDLGITRKERQNVDKNKAPNDIILDLIDKFNDYRENNSDLFLWKCPKCGEKHTLHRRKTDWKLTDKKDVVKKNTKK